MSLQIYTNGYVTFGLSYESRYPVKLDKNMLSYYKRGRARLQGFAMLSPMWTDNDAHQGSVTYHIYDQTQPGVTGGENVRSKVSSCRMFYLEVFICVRSMLRIRYSVLFVLQCIHVTCGGTIRHRAIIS